LHGSPGVVVLACDASLIHRSTAIDSPHPFGTFLYLLNVILDNPA
jgi:hypothetical protein